MESESARIPIADVARLLPRGMRMIADAARGGLVRPTRSRSHGSVTLSVKEAASLFQIDLGETMSAEETRDRLGVDGRGLERLVTGFWLVWDPVSTLFPAKLVRYWAALVKHDPTSDLAMAFMRASTGQGSGGNWNAPTTEQAPTLAPLDEPKDGGLAFDDLPTPTRPTQVKPVGTEGGMPFRGPNPPPGPDGADRRMGGPPPRGRHGSP